MFRFRDFRTDDDIRNKYAEVFLLPTDFIQPIFLVEGENRFEAISDLFDTFKVSIDQALLEISECIDLGIKDFYLFGLIDEAFKDNEGTAGYDENSLIVRALKRIKQRYPTVRLYTDVSLSPYTLHGHSGIVKNGIVDNDLSVPLLAKMAVQHALAGADYVCPTAKMDGQVEAIRKALHAQSKYSTAILSASVKFDSNFYGPARSGAGHRIATGDKKTYLLDYRNVQQTTGETWNDISEGADMIMVKPATIYLDVISKLKTSFPNTPIVGYHSSGEYMSIKLSAKAGILDEQLAFHEVLIAIKRAGASKIISYHAKKFMEQQYNTNYTPVDFSI
jgi:porphobilinogen synthase